MTRTRTPRPAGQRGRAWHKVGTRPLYDTGRRWNLANLPWIPERERLEVHRTHVERGDAAALVEAVRHCHETGEKIPAWIVAALEHWLAEFVAMAKPRTLAVSPARFVPWAATWLRNLCDVGIGDNIETNRDVYGMTEAEALDAASCELRGSTLAGNPATLRKAWQRARRRSRQGWQKRLPTSWEVGVLHQLAPDARPWRTSDPGHAWWIINSDRFGEARGVWRARPRCNLSALSTAELTRQAEAVLELRRKSAKDTRSAKVSGRKRPRSRTDT